MTTDLVFCGRDAELAMLAECWQRAADVDNPQPQLVVLPAEPGVGKTRLALEFLARQVAAQPGDSAYWPTDAKLADGRLRLNIPAEECRFDRPIPFLWWGIAAQAEGGDSVALHDRFLAPHLVAMSMRARVAGTGLSLAKIWGAAGADALASALQVDSVLSIGGAFLESVKLLHGEMGRGATQALAGDTLVKNRVDALLADLEQVLNPAARLGYARVPAIILIDDAQFAAADAGLLRFIERLTHAAMTQRWPVMILMTHWHAEWTLDAERGGRSVATLIHHARHGGSDEPGPISGAPGGYLNSENYREIRLAKLGDLDPALTAALPGLPVEQRRALLDAVDGNPRFLEQVIAYLRGEPRLFDDFDPARALTEEGLAEALSRSQRVHEVVLARLTSPQVAPEVREALALASVQGMRVVREVVEAAGQALLGHDLSEPLLRGQNPFSVMAFEADSKVGQFTERLFLQAAAQLRRNIKGLHDDRAVRAALRTPLFALLNELMTALPDGRSALTLAIAAKIVPTTIDDAAHIDQRALAASAAAALCMVADEPADRRMALDELVKSVFDGVNDDMAIDLLGSLPLAAILAVSNVALSADRVDLAKGVAGRYLEWVRWHFGAEVNADNAVPLAELSALLGDVAGLERRHGDAMGWLAEARNHFEFALEHAASRAIVAGLARVLLVMARFKGAAGYAREGFEDINALQALYGWSFEQGLIDETDRLRGVALVFESKIDILTAINELEAAQVALLECLSLTRQLAACGAPQDRRNLSVLLNRIADAEPDPAAALPMAHESVEIIYALLATAPSRMDYQRDLVVARTIRARVHARAGLYWEQQADLSEALGVADELHERLQTAGSAVDLRSALRNLFEAVAQAGDPARARPLLVRLVDLSPEGSPEREAAERALQGIDGQLADLADAPNALAPLAAARESQSSAEALIASGDYHAAFEAYREAFDILLPVLAYQRDEATLTTMLTSLAALRSLTPVRQPSLSPDEVMNMADRGLHGAIALLRAQQGQAAFDLVGSMLEFLDEHKADHRRAEFLEIVSVVRRALAKR